MSAERVCVVTGGAGLIGTAICSALAQAGEKVVIADADEAAARKLSKELNLATKGSSMPYGLDITNTGAIESLVSKLKAEYGSIFSLINNAYPRNKNYGRKLEEVEYKDFCENVSLHLGGYFLTSQIFCKEFAKQGFGRLINMSSIYGFLAPRFEVYDGREMTMPVEYAPIKAGIMQMTKYFAKYYLKAGIAANCISPGGIYADQDDNFVARYKSFCGVTGMLNPEHIAGVVKFLLSDDATGITGQNIVIDDGFSL